jgi:GTP-binding protein HflX
VTKDVLAEIGAGDVPSTVVMNKIDLLAEDDLASLRARQPDAWFVSARDPKDIATIRSRVIEIFEADYEEVELAVPYDRQAIVSEMHENGSVVEERWDDHGVVIRWRAEPEAIARARARLSRP